MHGVFIRAPAITAHGSGVEVLSTLTRGVDTTIVAVRQGNILATAFHVCRHTSSSKHPHSPLQPELGKDVRFHELFVAMVRANKTAA